MRETHTDIVNAVHNLELTLLEKIHFQTVALELNNQRLGDLLQKVDDQHLAIFGSHATDHVGLLQRTDILEQTEGERKWAVRTVSASFLALCGKFIWDFWQ